MLRRKEINPEDFWLEYEQKIGEKVLARSLGQYVSGWEEFDSRGWTAVWGLILSTSGGFRFHHFPQQSWFTFFTSGFEAPKEKTIFIPEEKIVSAKLIEETSWWKKILRHSPPHLLINYKDETENERQLLFETELQKGDLTESLNSRN